MELTDQELALLEAYYTGALPPAEKLAQEQRMQKEKDYGAAARDFLNGLEALEVGKTKTHRLYLQATMPAVRVSFVRRWWWAAAVVVGIVLGSVWWKITGEGSKSLENALADEYFTPYLSAIGRSSITDERPQGIIAYENDNFEGAIPFLQKEWASDKDPYTQFLLANAYLATGKPKLALPILIAVEGKPEIPPEATWYLALAYLKTGETEKCLERLNLIKNSNSTKKELAKSLMERLDNLK